MLVKEVDNRLPLILDIRNIENSKLLFGGWGAHQLFHQSMGKIQHW